MRFSITVTFGLENTSEREHGTISNRSFNQVKTRLTLRYSEYRAILEDINNSTKSPLANCN